jgi:hypothetical protein
MFTLGSTFSYACHLRKLAPVTHQLQDIAINLFFVKLSCVMSISFNLNIAESVSETREFMMLLLTTTPNKPYHRKICMQIAQTAKESSSVVGSKQQRMQSVQASSKGGPG